MSPTADKASRIFVYASTATAILIGAWFAYAASREWFIGDDFWFLAFAQLHKGWRYIFLPFGPRFWWSYRPLTTDVFFYVCFQLFERNPFGYLAVSVSMHLLTGLVVYRLARQFGFATRVAVVTALLSISRYPSLTEGIWISVSQYTFAVFFYALSLSFFIDYAKTSHSRFLIASCATLVLTLLSNEMGATLAAVIVLTSLYLNDFGISADRLIGTLRRTAPYLVITAGYLLFRTTLIGPALEVSTGYHWSAGWHIFTNYFAALVFVFGAAAVPLLGSLVPVAVALAAVCSNRENGGAAVKSLLGVSAVFVGWIVIGMLPYVGMSFPHPRFAMPIEVPVCLLCGACLNSFSVVYSSKHPGAVEVLLLAVLALSLPYRAAWERAMDRKGEPARRLVSLMSDTYPNVAKGTAVVVRYGADGLATPAESEEFWNRTFGSAVFWAFYYDKNLTLDHVDARRPLPPDLKCPPCIFLDLKPGLWLEPAQPEALLLPSP